MHRNSTDLNSCVYMCVFVFQCVLAVNSPTGSAYLQSTVQERVCHLDSDVCECDDGEGDVIVIFIRVLRKQACTL